MWQMLAGPLFANFVDSMTAQKREGIKYEGHMLALRKAIIKSVTAMTKRGYKDIERDLGRRLELVELEKLEINELFNGVSRLFRLPAISLKDVDAALSDFRRIDHEAGKAL